MTASSPLLAAGEMYQTCPGLLRVERLLGRGKSGYSYLCTLNGESYVLKLMHDEPVPYYTFGANKVHLEVQAYQRLQALGVRLPPLLDSDEGRNYLLKPFVDGPTATEAIAHGTLPDGCIREILEWSARLRSQGINLDWFPSNFVLHGSEIVYVDYELNPYAPEWSFEEWGIWYWANTAGMREFLAKGDSLCINENATGGKPRQPDEARRKIAWWLA